MNNLFIQFTRKKLFLLILEIYQSRKAETLSSTLNLNAFHADMITIDVNVNNNNATEKQLSLSWIEQNPNCETQKVEAILRSLLAYIEIFLQLYSFKRCVISYRTFWLRSCLR
jgi:hypothetical protein